MFSYLYTPHSFILANYSFYNCVLQTTIIIIFLTTKMGVDSTLLSVYGFPYVSHVKIKYLLTNNLRTLYFGTVNDIASVFHCTKNQLHRLCVGGHFVQRTFKERVILQIYSMIHSSQFHMMKYNKLFDQYRFINHNFYKISY